MKTISRCDRRARARPTSLNYEKKKNKEVQSFDARCVQCVYIHACKSACFLPRY